MLFNVLAAMVLGGCSHLNFTDLSTGATPLGGTPSDGTPNGGDGGTKAQNPPVDPPLVGDLTISKISVYQGVESVLYENGDAPNTLEMPLVVGRDALMRVFVNPKSSFDPRKVHAVLTVTDNSGDTEIEATIKVDRKSTDADRASTFNLEIPGDLMKKTDSLSVELREVGPNGPGGGTHKDVTWRSEQHGGLDIEETDTLHVKIVPIRYNFDGSGRLPDTSAAALQAIEEEVRGMYPVPDVKVSVDSPYDWNKQISANGDGWSSLLNSMVNYRGSRDEVPNTYYYAAFEPKASFYTFCAQGCVAGLSYIGYVSEPSTRASIGIGYNGWTADTLVHEMGHAHGREHAPCGNPAGPDPSYPYAGAKIGAWGYDIVSGGFADPNKFVDMMSYCTPIWISDYTFYALYQRIQAVEGSGHRVAVAEPRPTLVVEADGTTSPGATLSFESTDGAPRVQVDLVDEDGATAGSATAAFLPYDHLPGGMAILDQDLPAGWTARVNLP